jgi:hypothetical protein
MSEDDVLQHPKSPPWLKESMKRILEDETKKSKA